MAKKLKEIFGLREVTINVPDKDVPGLRKLINHGIKAGTLPQDASTWVPRPAKGTPAPAVGGQLATPTAKAPAAPSVPAQPRQASTGKGLGGWASWKDQQPTVNPAKPTPKDGVMDLDDPWFQDDKPTAAKKAAATPPPIPKAALKKAKQPLAPHLPAPKSAATKVGKGSADFKPGIDWSKDSAISGEFPDMPAPKSATSDAESEIDYKSPFAGLGLGSGGSSWDDIPAWARDPEKMPRAGGGSQRIPSSPTGDSPDDVLDIPGKLPKKGKSPSAVGKPWSDKDVEPKKQGMLSRLFGKKGS